MPEIRIHLRLTQGVLPVVIYNAIANDMFKTISNEVFLNAFLNPSSQETPSLVFHFKGEIKSFQFKILSRDGELIKLGSRTVFGTLLNILDAEKLPTTNKESHFFEYVSGEWKQRAKHF